MGISVRKSRLSIAVVIVASVAAVAYWSQWAAGSHRVVYEEVRPGEARARIGQSDEQWPAHAYLRPAVEHYTRDLARGSKVLDVGCGDGSLVASFDDRGWERQGIDISEARIAQAQKRFPNIQFAVADATEDLTPLVGTGRFDLVLSTEVIEHVMSPRAMLRNCFRVLRPGGRLVISTPYHGYLKTLAIAAVGWSDSHYDPLTEGGHTKFWSIETLGQALHEAGFRGLEFMGAGGAPYLWRSMVFKAEKPR